MKTPRYNSEADKAMSSKKRRIYGEIDAYRRKHGIGCFRDISAATGGKVAIHTISHMYTGTRIQNDIWLQVGAALEKLQARSGNS
jgi:hypothetical protein